MRKPIHWSFTHSPLYTHSLTHSFTHSLNSSLTHSLTHSFTHSFTVNWDITHDTQSLFHFTGTFTARRSSWQVPACPRSRECVTLSSYWLFLIEWDEMSVQKWVRSWVVEWMSEWVSEYTRVSEWMISVLAYAFRCCGSFAINFLVISWGVTPVDHTHIP